MNWKTTFYCWMPQPIVSSESEEFRFECTIKSAKGWMATVQHKTMQAYYMTQKDDLWFKTKRDVLMWCESFNKNEYGFKGRDGDKI